MVYLSKKEFAEALNISYTTLDNWLRKELISFAYKTPTGRMFFSQEQVDAFYRGELEKKEVDENEKI